LIPKFASEGSAKVSELRNRDTGVLMLETESWQPELPDGGSRNDQE